MLELRRPENAQGLLESLTKLAGGDKDKDKEVGPSATELEAIKVRGQVKGGVKEEAVYNSKVMFAQHQAWTSRNWHAPILVWEE